MKYEDIKNIEITGWISQIIKKMPKDIMDNCSLNIYSKNDRIIEVGARAEKVYIVVKGNVKIKNMLPNGVVYSFASMRAPFLLGEDETFASIKHYRGIVDCEGKCVAICMSKETFIEWMHKDISVLYEISSFIIKKHITQKIKDRSYLFLSGKSRLAYCLSEYYNIKQKDNECLLKITREHLADEIGFSVKTVNRCIAKLKDEQALSIIGHGIRINEQEYKKLISLLNN